MNQLSKRELALIVTVVALLFFNIVLFVVCVVQDNPCAEARDRCYTGCGEGWTEGLCKAQCGSAYEKCQLG